MLMRRRSRGWVTHAGLQCRTVDGDLDVRWIHGSRSKGGTDPPLQVHRYDEHTVILRLLATVLYATAQGWLVVIPPIAWAGGLVAALIIGALAGLLPALRAARMSPTAALWTS